MKTNKDVIKEIADYLFRIHQNYSDFCEREEILDESLGLCENFRRFLNDDLCITEYETLNYDYLINQFYDALKNWNLRSNSDEYPVPHPRLYPQYAYENRNLWLQNEESSDNDIEYIKTRLKLVLHVAEHFNRLANKDA